MALHVTPHTRRLLAPRIRVVCWRVGERSERERRRIVVGATRHPALASIVGTPHSRCLLARVLRVGCLPARFARANLKAENANLPPPTTCSDYAQLSPNRTLLTNRMKKAASAAFDGPDSFEYNNMAGLECLRKALAENIFNRYFLNGTDHTVSPDDIVCSSGGSALLNFLFTLLANEKTAVLIPAPFYAAFENDMKVLANLVPFPVPLEDEIAGPTSIDLDRAKAAANAQGLSVSMLLLTNPNNPLGVIYSFSTISSCIGWARNQLDQPGVNTVHVLVDEIYALSEFESDLDKKFEQKFVSAAKVLNNRLGDDVHILWGLSKDFGSSGFRCGVLYTQNELVKKALGSINMFAAIGHPLQKMIAHMLSDDKFVDTYLGRARSDLVASYSIVTSTLTSLDLPFVEARAGIFLWADFSSLLPEMSWEGEEALVSMFFEEKVVMTPGQSTRAKKPGMFRICYAWVGPEVLQIAMGRIKAVADKVKLTGWIDLEAEERDDRSGWGVRRRGSSYAH